MWSKKGVDYKKLITRITVLLFL